MLMRKTVQELAHELVRQTRTRQDYYAPGDQVKVELATPLLDQLIEDASKRQGIGRAEIQLGLGAESFPLNGYAHGQLAQRLGIPKRYYDRMREEAPELLRVNLSHWLEDDPKRTHLIRTLDGRARAVLSSRYRMLDHWFVVDRLLPTLNKYGFEIHTSEVTDQRMYVYALSSRLEGQVRVGDVVRGGILLRNSEVGAGKLQVSLFLYTLRCTNGAIGRHLFGQVHIGTDVEVDDSVQQYIRGETQEKMDEATVAGAADVIAGLVETSAFSDALNVMREAAGQPIVAPVMELRDRVIERLAMRQPEADSFIENLVRSNDLTRYGAFNAITATANTGEDFDRSVELQEIGARVLEMNITQWEAFQGLR